MAKAKDKVLNPLGSTGSVSEELEKASTAEKIGDGIAAVPGYVVGKGINAVSDGVGAVKKGSKKLHQLVVENPSKSIATGVGNAVAAFMYGTSMTGYQYGDARSAVQQITSDAGKSNRLLPSFDSDAEVRRQALMKNGGMSL